MPAALLSRSSRKALFVSPRPCQHFTPRFQSPRHFRTSAIAWEQQQANIKAKRDPAPKVVRGDSKVFKNADEAVADIESGAMILSAGFGLCGTAGS